MTPAKIDDGTCNRHSWFESEITGMRRDLREILRRLGDGDITLATLDSRLKITERIVYGTVALVLAGVLGALLAVVIRSS
jgi:hypothetical protein